MVQPLIMPFHGKTPKIHDSAFIAPGAVVIGDVEIGADASIWYGCVLRGDNNAIRVGAGSNVQDGTIVHVDPEAGGGTPCLIGEKVLIGHACMLHGCTLENEAFVGMRSTVLDGAVIQTGGFLAAGAFLGGGKTLPAGEMWGGLPARKLRDLRPGEERMAGSMSEHYIVEGRMHAEAVADFRGG